MDKIKPTVKEAQILAAAQLQAQSSARDLAREAKVAEHMVRYCLNKYVGNGFLKQRTMLNPGRLGYVPYILLFSVSYSDQGAEERLTKVLITSELTASVFEIGGDYQFGVLLYSKDVLEVSEFLNSLSALKGVRLIERSIGVRLSTTLFRRRYLSEYPSNVETLSIERQRTFYVADELDHRILKGLAQGQFDSQRELSRKLNLSHTTLDSRVRKLEESGVIAGYVYGMDVSRLGRSTTRLLISSRGVIENQWKKVLSFAQSEPEVVQATRALGSWDFELLAETETGQSIVEIIRRLHSALDSDITSIHTLPVFRYLKVNEYPRTFND